jgi:hypothetical protein
MDGRTEQTNRRNRRVGVKWIDSVQKGGRTRRDVFCGWGCRGWMEFGEMEMDGREDLLEGGPSLGMPFIRWRRGVSQEGSRTA